jgi:radical SAM superfamily enzyme YgiQ (UPF0313 family)
MRVLLVVYDNDSYIAWFPQGLAYVASVLRKKGHEVVIYNQDVYHWPESHLKDFLDKNKFDVVGVSVIAGYYQYHKLLKISRVINQSKNRPFYILGGHGPAPEPEYFMKKTRADVIVIGEGEITAVEILEALNKKKKFCDVKGIAYRDGKKVIVTPRRPLIENIDKIDFPAYDLFPIDHYALMRTLPALGNDGRCLPMLSGRGCIFQCNFCYRMDKGFRPRSIDGILEEVGKLQKDYGINSIIFSDDLLMSSVNRTIAVCEGILKSKIRFKWGCNGRLNFAKLSVLKLMKSAGCLFINYGIESMDQDALNVMKKGLTVSMIYEGIENTYKAGMSPGLNIIFGNIGETRAVLKKDVEFLLKYDDHAQRRTIRPVTPYPGSPLYYYAIEKGLLKDVRDFYENKHVNSDLLAVNFTNMSDEEFHKALFRANKKLLSKYFDDMKQKTIEEAKKLYLEKNTAFRGFRH